MKTIVECSGESYQVTHEDGNWKIFPTPLTDIRERKIRCIAAGQETSFTGPVIVRNHGMAHDEFVVLVGKDDVSIEPLPFCSHETRKVLDLALEQIYIDSRTPGPDAEKDMQARVAKIVASIPPARTRPIKSECRLLTTWQTEILEIMEANNVPEETIAKVLDLL